MTTLLQAFKQGCMVGIVISAPIGPVALFIIQRSLVWGRLSGFMAGLAASSVNVFFAFIALLGLSTMAPFLTSRQWLFHLIGGGVLLILGVKTIFALRQPQPAHQEPRSLIRDFFTTIVLEAANPLTILPIAILIGNQHEQLSSDTMGMKVLLLIGVFLGTLGWWMLVTCGVDGLRHLWKHRQHQVTMWINRFSGGILALFGMLLLLR